MYFNELVETATILLWIASGALLLTFCIQLYYYLYIFTRIPVQKKKSGKSKKFGVSVIICSRNESDFLKNNLPAFLEQDYPEFEVVVVNDCSTDDTEDVLMSLKEKYQNLRFTTIQPDHKFSHGKKLAMTVGIKSAKYDHLLFSEADCRPLSRKWIKNMSRNFSSKHELVLGISKYGRRKGLLNYFIRYDALFTGMEYASFALIRRPIRGLGKNMGYTKDLFFRNKGFASHLKVLAGEDDLFVNEVAGKQNTGVAVSKDSLVICSPTGSFLEWFVKKKLQLSTIPYYKKSSRFRIASEMLSRLIFYVAAIFLLTVTTWRWGAAIALFVLMVVKGIIIKLNMMRLHEKDLLVSSLLIDPLMPLILGIIRIANIFRPRRPKWN